MDIPPEHKSVEHIMEVVRDANKPKEVTLREISSAHVDQIIVVEGKAVAISDPEIIPTTTRYECLNCEPDRDGNPVIYDYEPKKCPKCGESDFTEREAELEDVQVIKVHESKPKNNHIAKLTIVTRGTDAMWKIRAGQKIRAIGKLQVDKVRLALDRKSKSVKRLEATELSILDNMDIKWTEADIAKFKGIMEQPIAWQILVGSFAPHLVGLDEQKQVCIHTLGSCNTPRPFNSIICGPPGRGKTQLLEYTAGIHPLGIKITATGASMAGLTSISVKDDDTGAWETRLGLFGLYNTGVVCITELQAISGKDIIKSLNDALESKEVSSARADGPVKVDARCGVIFDTNNFNGAWAYDFPLAHNLKYLDRNLGPFISRLDLVSIVPQVNNMEYFDMIARSNFKTSTTTEALEKYRNDWEKDGITYLGTESLQKYFAYVSSLPLPEIPPELEDMFAKNYVEVSTTTSAYTGDGRYNRKVRTLAQVRARLLLKERVDKEDLEIAIMTINQSMEIETKDGDTYDANAALGLSSKKAIAKRENMTQQFTEAIKKAIEKNEQAGKGAIFTVSDLEFEFEMDATTRNNWDETKIKSYIQRANAEGAIYESLPGQWKKA